MIVSESGPGCSEFYAPLLYADSLTIWTSIFIAIVKVRKIILERLSMPNHRNYEDFIIYAQDLIHLLLASSSMVSQKDSLLIFITSMISVLVLSSGLSV